MQYSTAKQLIKMMGKHHLVKLLEWMNEDALESAISLHLACNLHDDFQYEGEYRNDEEFAQELLDSTGDIPDDFPFYISIDWEVTARNIMADYVEENGHYFRY